MRALAIGFLALCSCPRSPEVSGDGSALPTSGPPSPAAAGSATAISLGIPLRKQWEHGHGYCGETAIQAVALTYGAWISQRVVRQVAGGELLLGDNDEQALTTLRLMHITWTSSASAQADAFIKWMQQQIVARRPVIYAVYLAGSDDPDYDHIVPAIGIDDIANELANQKLVSSNNFGHRIALPFDRLAATRANCRRNQVAGGCIPAGKDYGVAITGIAGTDRPVTIAVAGDREPNVSLGEAVVSMTATLTVRELAVGGHYTLQRADGVNGTYRDVVGFVADKTTWSTTDAFPSDSATYYRCIAR